MQNKKHNFDNSPEVEATSDPMDIWLKQQLGALHADMLDDELPDEIGKLAAALEARLLGQAAPAAAGNPGTETREDDEAEPEPVTGPGGGNMRGGR